MTRSFYYFYFRTSRWMFHHDTLFLLFLFSDITLDVSPWHALFISFIFGHHAGCFTMARSFYYFHFRTSRWMFHHDTLFLLFLFSDITLDVSPRRALFISFIFGHHARCFTMTRSFYYFYFRTSRWMFHHDTLFLLFLFSNITLDVSPWHALFISFIF